MLVAELLGQVGRAVGAVVVDDEDVGVGQRRADRATEPSRCCRPRCRSGTTTVTRTAASLRRSHDRRVARPVAVATCRPAERPLSALPPPRPGRCAFVAILLGGFAGGLIGYTLVELQCDGDCALPHGLGVLVGAVVAAVGMSIVAVLVLRALGEWREIERPRRRHAPR